MEHEFWHARWAQNQIGFHQDSINAYLQAHWRALAVTGDEAVLVPLCGKSHDMWWLHDRGHPVLGVELSQIACKDFFEEGQCTATVRPDPRFTIFAHDDLQLWCGDFFNLTEEDLSSIKLVYDRAALIAFPPEMRRRYVDHLTRILKPGARILLITIEYPQDAMQGPPFSVRGDEIEQLYGRDYHIERLHEQDLARDDPFAKRRGLSAAREVVYGLSKDR
ncbi:thiopurine S-methyltransferase [Mangrovitalea sediminis]|uniref:thiopurine S-methyltransferase n=1 Tax=Mangrovitalea sediminis TaxID=1982043 RepID=UPI000BE59DB6|nr:thiopurine S-methyltransferase [Mangrovitalea sediminis]